MDNFSPSWIRIRILNPEPADPLGSGSNPVPDSDARSQLIPDSDLLYFLKCVWSCTTCTVLSSVYILQHKFYIDLMKYRYIAGLLHCNGKSSRSLGWEVGNLIYWTKNIDVTRDPVRPSCFQVSLYFLEFLPSTVERWTCKFNFLVPKSYAIANTQISLVCKFENHKTVNFFFTRE